MTPPAWSRRSVRRALPRGMLNHYIRLAGQRASCWEGWVNPEMVPGASGMGRRPGRLAGITRKDRRDTITAVRTEDPVGHRPPRADARIRHRRGQYAVHLRSRSTTGRL